MHARKRLAPAGQWKTPPTGSMVAAAMGGGEAAALAMPQAAAVVPPPAVIAPPRQSRSGSGGHRSGPEASPTVTNMRHMGANLDKLTLDDPAHAGLVAGTGALAYGSSAVFAGGEAGGNWAPAVASAGAGAAGSGSKRSRSGSMGSSALGLTPTYVHGPFPGAPSRDGGGSDNGFMFSATGSDGIPTPGASSNDLFADLATPPDLAALWNNSPGVTGAQSHAPTSSGMGGSLSPLYGGDNRNSLANAHTRVSAEDLAAAAAAIGARLSVSPAAYEAGNLPNDPALVGAARRRASPNMSPTLGPSTAERSVREVLGGTGLGGQKRRFSQSCPNLAGMDDQDSGDGDRHMPMTFRRSRPRSGSRGNLSPSVHPTTTPPLRPGPLSRARSGPARSGRRPIRSRTATRSMPDLQHALLLAKQATARSRAAASTQRVSSWQDMLAAGQPQPTASAEAPFALAGGGPAGAVSASPPSRHSRGGATRPGPPVMSFGSQPFPAQGEAREKPGVETEEMRKKAKYAGACWRWVRRAGFALPVLTGVVGASVPAGLRGRGPRLGCAVSASASVRRASRCKSRRWRQRSRLCVGMRGARCHACPCSTSCVRDGPPPSGTCTSPPVASAAPGD